ncbi:hypothetical protein W02_42040 [Nitrospira sp. KM1]|uniref:hypothetical protein n=1 Tax=Nitrospira sp. KM1 TaxID=1936990 RepID=UPI0013A7A419|nr:hypothetical protein [Nitrospira sp. KM1]BCA57064.1 hypothetical protein W02_42040 [Nitrospira sp. KM1]
MSSPKHELRLEQSMYLLPDAGRNVLSPTDSNIITGVVVMRTKGLTRTALLMRVGDHTHLRVRWTGYSPAHETVQIGDEARVCIAENVVNLEAGTFRRGKQRWNRWIGTVVMNYHCNYDNVTTVRLDQDNIVLKSRSPISEGQPALSTGDRVNVVIDPHDIRLLPTRQKPTPPLPLVIDESPTHVWLHATITVIRLTPIGQHIALTLGNATMAALVEMDEGRNPGWSAGTTVRISIHRTDGFIRRDLNSPIFRCCIILSSEFAGH